MGQNLYKYFKLGFMHKNLEGEQELNFSDGKATSKMKILQVINAEQMITAPNLGLKGKPDLVVLCEITSSKGEETHSRRCFLPLELKTGEKEYYIYNMQVSNFFISISKIQDFDLLPVADATTQTI